MLRMKLAFVVSVSCVLGFVFAPSARGDQKAGGTVLQEVTPSEALVVSQALIGPQVALNESFRGIVMGDYVAAGVGMRNLGGGTINIALPGGSTIARAFLYWALIRDKDSLFVSSSFGKLNGQFIGGIDRTTLIGSSGDPCWPFFGAGNFIDVFRAEVTGIAQQGANVLSNFPSGLTNNTPPQNAPEAFPLLEGASLVVIFENPSFGFNTVVIRDGVQTLNRETLITSFGSFTAETASAPDEIAKTTYIVADGQAQFQADQATFKGIVVAGPTSGEKSVDAFDGADGIANVFPSDGLWDTLTVDVSLQFTPGVATSADAGVVAGTGGDCLTWVAQVLSVKSAPVPPVVTAPGPTDIVTAIGRSIDPNLPTIVLTHGLQKKIGTNPDDIWTGFGTDKTAGSILDDMFGGFVNILQYVWEDANQVIGFPTQNSYVKARQNVYDAGERLAGMLVDELGPGYDKSIHFIGHSLGTAVNAYAAQLYLNMEPSVTKSQFTILDYPNRIDKLFLVSPADEKLFGFDRNFFASVLPVTRPGLSLKIDNYYSLTGVSVGNRVNGPAYNHDARFDRDDREETDGLEDPGEIGDTFFQDEEKFGFISNDHTGVHQWYRWTIRPVDPFPALLDPLGGTTVCKGDQFAPGRQPRDFDDSLNPCQRGWYWSIHGPKPGSFPDKFPGNNGGSADGVSTAMILERYINFGCVETDGGVFEITCVEASSPFGVAEVNVPADAKYMSFEYKFSNVGDGDYAVVLIDGIPIWVLSGLSVIEEDEFEDSGPIPIAGFPGRRWITVALYGVGDPNAEFVIKNFSFLSFPEGVDIDIKPGHSPNSINRGKKGVTPVAILSAENFNAPMGVDEMSLTFGRTGDEESLAFCDGGVKDVNDDDLPDLICHFDTLAAGFQLGNTAGILKGETVDGMEIFGSDSVRIIGK